MSSSRLQTATHPVLGRVIAKGVVGRQEKRRLKALKLANAIVKTDAPSIMHRFLSMPADFRGCGLSVDLKDLRNTAETRRFFRRLAHSHFLLYYCDAEGAVWRLRIRRD